MKGVVCAVVLANVILSFYEISVNCRKVPGNENEFELGVVPPPVADRPDCFDPTGLEIIDYMNNIPDPENCKAYYECVNTQNYGPIPHNRTCPGGFYFNFDTCRCDHPSPDGSTCFSWSNPDHENNLFKCACSLILGSDNNLHPNPNDPKCGIEEPTCQDAEDREYIGEIPDPENCDKFYSCVHTQQDGSYPVSQPCPPSLHYSFKTCTCEESLPGVCFNKTDPEHIKDRWNCACPLIPNPDGPGLIPDPECTGNGEDPITPPDFTCVGRPDGDYPNPYNCSTFYSCSNEIAYLMNCYPGLLFDMHKLWCASKDENPICATP